MKQHYLNSEEKSFSLLKNRKTIIGSAKKLNKFQIHIQRAIFCFVVLLNLFPIALAAQTSRSNNKKINPYRSNFQRMASGNFSGSSFEIRSGTLWAWGNNAFSQLGNGNNTAQSAPIHIGSSMKWVSVTSGLGHTLGIQADGTLWGWGFNNYGQLGFANPTSQSTPTQIGSDNKWVSVAAGGVHSIGLKSDGTLWAWGYNSDGQLGLGDYSNRSVPVQIGTDNKWVTIAAGRNQSFAIKSDGTLWAWGFNDDGELGINNTVTQNVPVQVGLDNNWVSISGGSSHTLGIKADGTLWAWGYNLFGQLGVSDNSDRIVPTQVGNETNWVSVSLGENHSLGLKANGTLWSWGWNFSGPLGLGDNTDRNTPSQVGTDNNWVSIAAGQFHSLGSKADGTLHTWGSNLYGQLGIGNQIDSNTPAQASIATGYWLTFTTGGNHTVGIKADGTLWAWGKNDVEQLGLGDFVNRNIPVQVGTGNSWVCVAAGYGFTLGLQADGTLWAWGFNGSGQLGVNDNVSRNTPFQVGTDKNWVSIATGGDHSLGLKSDGTLWAWGLNTNGQLGINSLISQISPVQVGTDHKWVSIAGGYNHSMGLKSDGTLWTWGDNTNGQLGLGNNTGQTIPVQVGIENKWSTIDGGSSHTLCIKSDGTLWSCGFNVLGQLGLSDNVDRNSLTQVTTGSQSWINIIAGANHSLGLGTDGSLWTWGWNFKGQLGIGNLFDQNLPILNTSQSNIVTLRGGFAHSGIVKSTRDNVCMTGDNSSGQLGHSTFIDENIFGCSQIDPCLNFSVSVVVTDSIKCFDAAGHVLVSATGGLPPYTGTGTIAQGATTTSYTVTDSQGCSANAGSITLTQPTELTLQGSTTPTNCSGNNGTATIIPSGGTPGYHYTWRPGGQNTGTITGLSPGNDTALVTDANGCTAFKVLTVGSGGTILPGAPSTPSGRTVVCKGDCITYSIPPVLYATSYQWTISGKGVTGSSNGTSFTVCYTSKFKGGSVCVKAINACGPGPVTCLDVNPATKPAKADAIIGETIVCSATANQQTYCVALDPQSTSYSWIIKGNASPGLSISSGQGSNCIVVIVPAGYQGGQELSVKGVNCKDFGDEKKINIKSATSAPSQPSVISGPSSVCRSNKDKGYSVGSISNASNYTWTITGGALIASGQGTKDVKIDFRNCTSSSVIITVTASNGCGTSAPRTKTVSVNLSCKVGAESSEDIVQSKSINDFYVFPNPTSGKVSVNFYSTTNEKGILKLVDLAGRQLISKDISIEEGMNSGEINLENIAKGLYLISVQNGKSEIQWLRLIVE